MLAHHARPPRAPEHRGVPGMRTCSLTLELYPENPKHLACTPAPALSLQGCVPARVPRQTCQLPCFQTPLRLLAIFISIELGMSTELGMSNIIIKGASSKLVSVCVQGEFVADESDGGFTKGTQWLVWRFESDSTLGDAVQVYPGQHPYQRTVPMTMLTVCS